jgi:hypothetical protein
MRTLSFFVGSHREMRFVDTNGAAATLVFVCVPYILQMMCVPSTFVSYPPGCLTPQSRDRHVTDICYCYTHNSNNLCLHYVDAVNERQL